MPARATSTSIPASAPVLALKGLTIRTAGGKTLVKDMSLTLAKGETLAVVGESGSGKTLTALSLLGLVPPELVTEVASLTIGGEEMAGATNRQWQRVRGTRVAMIFQEPATALNPVMTCGAQIEETFRIHGNLGARARKARVDELLRQVHLPEPARIAASYPHEISGGQRQRVMIAMALAHAPDVLVADEPTTALDVTVQAEILALVKGLQKKLGMAMVWVTHDFGVVKELATRTVVMNGGAVVEHGPTATVLAKPKAPYTKRLLAATLALNPTPPKLAKNAKPLLKVENLSYTYPPKGSPWLGALLGRAPESQPAVHNLSCAVPAGSTLGVVGESGSGKSTLARLLTRLVPPQAGSRVVFMGTEMSTLSRAALRVARRDMQMVFQDPVTSLNPKLTVADAIAEGIRAHRLLPEAAIPARVAELLGQVGLPAEAATRLPHQFSGGQRQRIAIARALALNPKLIVADEPVSALDVSIQAQILALFQSVQATTGTAYVFISHDLRVISHVAHQVLVMHRGQVVEAGPTAEVFRNPQHPYTRQLLKAVV